jgi:hypothetical protein
MLRLRLTVVWGTSVVRRRSSETSTGRSEGAEKGNRLQLTNLLQVLQLLGGLLEQLKLR